MEGGNKEKLEKERLEREKKMLEIENSDLESRYKVKKKHPPAYSETIQCFNEFIISILRGFLSHLFYRNYRKHTVS